MSRARRRQKYERRVEAALLAAVARGELKAGTVCTIDVLHDPWCGIYKGTGRCNCNPALGEIRPVEGRSLLGIPAGVLAHGRKPA